MMKKERKIESYPSRRERRGTGCEGRSRVKVLKANTIKRKEYLYESDRVVEVEFIG